MAQYDTPTTLSGLFKEVYGDNVMNLVPDSAKIVKLVPFVSRDKEIGNKYHQPVVVSWEHGMTYAAFDDGAFALNSSIAMALQDAQVSSSQMLLRAALSYDAAARASNSKKAFVKATELIVENMLESITKRVEIACLYGGSGIGVGDSSVNTDSTHTVVTLLTASWATGIWAGMENATIQFYKVSDGTLVSSGADSIYTISGVNADDKQLTLTGTATGVTDLDTALAAGDCTIFFNGSKAKEMSGLDAIITNTGTLFNISAATYNLWKGNSYSASSAALTMGKLLAGISKAVERGLDEKVVTLLNPKTWGNVMSDLAALRRFDGSYNRKKGENGMETLVFYGQNGENELVPHNIVKEGEAFVFPPKKCSRIGAQDISFKTPGREEEIFTQLANNAGYELRVYTDQAIFLETPARAVKITAVVNS